MSPKKSNDSGFEMLDLSLDLGDFKPSPPGKKKKKKKSTGSPAPAQPFVMDLFAMETDSPRFNNLSQSDDSGFGQGQEDDGHHTDGEADIAGEVQGEFAMDMFLDPTNPFNKIVHTSLKSTIEKQKKNVEEVTQLRQEQLRDQGFRFYAITPPIHSCPPLTPPFHPIFLIKM